MAIFTKWNTLSPQTSDGVDKLHVSLIRLSNTSIHAQPTGSNYCNFSPATIGLKLHHQKKDEAKICMDIRHCQ